MKKKVIITIEVDMNSPQVKEWHKPSDYFTESVKDTLVKIREGKIKNHRGSLKTDSEKSSYVLTVHTF